MNDTAESQAKRVQNVIETNKIDNKMGFARFDSGRTRTGWLVNFQPTTASITDTNSNGLSAVDFYFIDEEGGYFKSQIHYEPYFYVQCVSREEEVIDYLNKKLEKLVTESKIVIKEDLSLANHLLGEKRRLVQLKFANIVDFQAARRTLQQIVSANKKYAEMYNQDPSAQSGSVESVIVDLREHDVPYHVRVVIDLGINVGKWYTVSEPPFGSTNVIISEVVGRESRADPVVMAYDIETTKQPLKFPDARIDVVMMISYMIDGQGYLIINREVVSADIDDFEYTPKPEYPGPFTVFNESTERDLLLRFFEHIQEEKPTVIATFNGDFFDWPFVAARAQVHGISMYNEIGFSVDAEGEFKSSYCAHMDCFRWVKRDSYLPQGSQGLKAVTSTKLGYTPLEIDPEQMTPFALEKPQVMAEYSVSDAVATYYLYMKYVHPFIFSLCTILPLRPDEVLRKGTGTLCEMLLMVQAYAGNILLPQKHSDPIERYYNGHLVESETYVGGHVESLEAGVFREDIKTKFEVEVPALEELLSQLDAALRFTVETELKLSMDDIVNFEEIKTTIENALIELKKEPKREEEPLIYHVDVASMYPNIMTSNRLQPDSMKSERDCAVCDFNVPNKICDRRLPWAWRGEFYPPQRDEVLMIEQQLSKEKFPHRFTKKMIPYEDLSRSEQVSLLRTRVSDYSRKVYHKIKQSETIEREAIICQRENPFYVDTVRAFRDRRYEYKGKQKQSKIELSNAKTAVAKEEAAKMVVLYDSMQLAHKVILNSFYGYVMRKGSRWYSMEMAGVTCLTGATIIQLARGMVERLGRPLELDTDGIWCILPKTFPGDFSFKLKSGKKIGLAYPCVMLNHLVHEKFTNHQYQTLIDKEKFIYETSSDNTIFFEVDGPYRAMMLPSSREEGKGLKKRYAVYNSDGSLAELKGFEMKRRGELQLIKSFQVQLFANFLKGDSLEGCYEEVAKVANSWLDVLDSKGSFVEEADLMNLISENKSMSKSLAEYGSQKSTSICTARRLADLLGPDMVKDKGLACKYIISAEPASEPVTNRAIPIQIFDSSLDIKQKFLRRWLKKPGLQSFDPREIIDWAYYRERLAATIQKLIVIPAARQGIANPVPRVPPPIWLIRQIKSQNDTHKQQFISFEKSSKDVALWGKDSAQKDGSDKDASDEMDVDIENLPGQKSTSTKRAVVKRRHIESDEDNNEDDMSNIPDVDVDYRGWVVGMKKVWDKQIEQYQQSKQLFGPLAMRNSRGIQGILRQQTEKTWKNGGGTWQIIQVQDKPDNGQVKAFVKIGGKLQNVTINVQREVFAVLRDGHDLPDFSDQDDIYIEKSNSYLPSGAQINNLYRIMMSPRRFELEHVKANGLFKNRCFQNIYEQHVTGCDRVQIMLGSRCEIQTANNVGIIGKGLESGFDFKWLRSLPVEEDAKDLAGLDFVFVHHFALSSQHVIIIYVPWSSDVKIIEYAPKAVKNSDSAWENELKFQYDQQVKVHTPPEPLFKFLDTMESVEKKKYSDLRQFWSNFNKILTATIAKKASTVCVAVQGDRGLTWLSNRCRAFSNVPTFDLGLINDTTLSSVGWHSALSRRSIKQYLRSQFSLMQLQAAASQVNIPIGNTPVGEDIRQAIDYAYARRLKAANHVIWWLDTATDDTLLNDIDANDTLNVDATLSSKSNLISDAFGTTQDELSSSEMPVMIARAGGNCGVYSNVCLDISVGNLIVNTILQSYFLAAAEGSDPADPSFVMDAFSPLAWKVLVQMTKDWWAQASSGNEIADQCVQQIVGWVLSPGSKLWSPRLAHQVNTLSNSALTKLATEFKKLGTSVIYCSRSGQRLLLSTTKKNADSAQAFGGLLVRETKANDLFAYLDLNVNEVWDFLIWLDEGNFGGRLLSVEGQLEYSSQWTIAESLPKMLKDEFYEWILQFMALFAESKDNQSPMDFSGLHKPLYNRVRQLQNRYIDSLSSRVGSGDSEKFKRPELASPMSNDTNPVLSFVKMVLTIFSLGHTGAEFSKLRRQLLGILQVGDFDRSGSYVPIPQKLYVRDVVCQGCMASVDINICSPVKDEGYYNDDETSEQLGEDVLQDKFAYLCPSCGTAFDRLFLEGRLVQMLIEMVVMFQCQDLKCLKCGKVRPDDMAEYCPCSGRFTNTINDKIMKNRIDVLKHVSSYFDLRMLRDALSQY